MQIVLTLNLLLVNILDVFLFDLVECGPVLSLSLRLEYLGLKIDLLQRPHTMMGITSTRQRLRVHSGRVAACTGQLEQDTAHFLVPELHPFFFFEQGARFEHGSHDFSTQRLCVCRIHRGHFMSKQSDNAINDSVLLEVRFPFTHLLHPIGDRAQGPRLSAPLEVIGGKLRWVELPPLAGRNGWEA